MKGTSVDMPPPIERVRMCLAEIGYDPTRVTEPRPDEAALGSDFTVPYGWSVDDMWRACETALVGAPMCFTCTLHNNRRLAHGLHIESCDATRRGLPDCGRTRMDNEAT